MKSDFSMSYLDKFYQRALFLRWTAPSVVDCAPANKFVGLPLWGVDVLAAADGLRIDDLENYFILEALSA